MPARILQVSDLHVGAHDEGRADVEDAIRALAAAEQPEAVVATGAGTLLAGDMGCLLNMAGKLSRARASVRARHVAEVLAGMADGPAIGEKAD